MFPFLPWIGLLLGFLCLLAALRSNKRRRLVDNLPTSKTTGVYIGLVELKGNAEAERPLISFLSEQACVHYAYSVEEHWSRTVTETYTDSHGKTQTRTRHESGWTTVDSGGEMMPFYVRDDQGAVRVAPEGAEIEPVSMFDQTCGLTDPLYYAKGPATAIGNSDHRRHFCEQGIPLHAPLYIMGQARERKDVVAPEIARDDQTPMFLISTRSEEQVSSSYKWGYWGWVCLGVLLSGLGVFGRDYALNNHEPSFGFYAWVALSYLVIWIAGWIWMVFNSLVDLRQRVRQAWAQVDVQLKRRHDLIPNLVETVQGLRDYEQMLQTQLAALRVQMEATPPGVSGPDFAACGPLLVAIQERYPELKAQESFMLLQKNLSETEQRIALARTFFNDIATFYNTRLEVVPDRYVACLGRLRAQPLMAANEFERAPVEVKWAA